VGTAGYAVDKQFRGREVLIDEYGTGLPRGCALKNVDIGIL